MKNETSLKDSLYAAVLEGIFANEYRPGQILNERELIEKYGYSKSPVREALIALCNDNVLRNIPRCGYEVVRLTREDVEDMLRARYLIEGGMLMESVGEFTPGRIERLRAIDDECTRYDADVWKHWESNTAFHLYLVSAAGNQFVEETVRCIMGRLKRAYAQFFFDKLDSLALSDDTSRHKFIIEAIEERDVPRLLSALKDDLRHFGSMSRVAIPEFFPGNAGKERG